MGGTSLATDDASTQWFLLMLYIQPLISDYQFVYGPPRTCYYDEVRRPDEWAINVGTGYYYSSRVGYVILRL